MSDKINADKIRAVFMDCLFRDSELTNDGQPPENAVLVSGVLCKFGFHKERLGLHGDEIVKWLSYLPNEFKRSAGGGMSFLNACVDEDGEQWGEHRNMDELFCLGLALGVVKCQLPREVWGALPGGMPYYVVLDAEKQLSA